MLFCLWTALFKFYRSCLLALGPLVPWDGLCSRVTRESSAALCWAQGELALQQVLAWPLGDVLWRGKAVLYPRETFPYHSSVLRKLLSKACPICWSSMATTRQTHLPGGDWHSQHKAGGQERFPEAETGPTARHELQEGQTIPQCSCSCLCTASPSPNCSKGHLFLAKRKVDSLEQEARLGHQVS